MIIKKRKDLPPKKYGKYFLAFEAPGDEEEENTPIETSEVSPIEDDDEDTDFTSIGFDDETNEPGNDVPDEEDMGDDDSTDFSNIGIDDDEDGEEDTGTTLYQAPENEQPPTDAPEEDAGTEEVPDEPTGEETPEEPATDDATPEETPTEDDPGDVGGGDAEDTPTPDEGDDATDADAGDTGDEPEPEEDADFTGMGDDEDSGVTDADANDAAKDEGEKKGPGLEYDSTRKYKLFQSYISLYNATNNYISKLENNVKDDIIINRVIKEATNRLREIRELCYDYMLIKFEISTYTQSLMFYETLIVAIQTVFRMISDVNGEFSKSKEKQSHEKRMNKTIE